MKVERIKKSSSHHFPIIFPAKDVAGKFVHEVYGLSAVSVRLTVAYPYNNYTTKRIQGIVSRTTTNQLN